MRLLVTEFAPPGKVIPVQVGEWGYSSADNFDVRENFCCSGAKLSEEQHAHVVARLLLVSIASGADFAMMYEWADNSHEKMGLVQPTPSLFS